MVFKLVGSAQQRWRAVNAPHLVPLVRTGARADGTDVGMLHTEHRPAELYLARIKLHPDHQGRGIGSHLIRTLLRQAHRQGKPLALDVLVVNHRALTLYRRLGLHEVARHGENNVKIRMSTGPPQHDSIHRR
jgi:ribosomal protein S18 acetylase RimI-like enzyme